MKMMLILSLFVILPIASASLYTESNLYGVPVSSISGDTYLTQNYNNLTGGDILSNQTIINFTTYDASIKLYASEHKVFGENNGESIELWSLKGESKPYLGWYSYDQASDSIRATGWIGCHYNLTNGDTHQHCSWETLDNYTGIPTVNTKLEIKYGSNLSNADSGLYAKFTNLDRLELGYLVDLYLKDGNIEGNSELDFYPDNEFTLGFRIDNTSDGTTITAMGSDTLACGDDLLFIGDEDDIRHKGALDIFPNNQVTYGLRIDNRSDGVVISSDAGTTLYVGDDLKFFADSYDILHSSQMDIFPDGQTTRGFRVDQDGTVVQIYALGSSVLRIDDTLQVGAGSVQTNITMTSPNGQEWTCGVDNSGVFQCT